jgi:PAS domain S-box-containing protein
MPKRNKYQSIFETTLDGIIVINTRGVIEEINSAGLFLFGYPKKDMVGKNISVLMPEPDKSQHDGYLHNYNTTRKPKIIGIGREVEGLKKDGTVFPFRLAVSEFETNGVQYFTGIIHDLTQRKLQERIIRGYAEELEERVESRTLELGKEIELRETAQKALIAGQRLYETIAKNYPNGTITVVGMDNNIVYVEGSELRKIGLDHSELLGQNYLQHIPDEWRDLVGQKIKDVFAGEEGNFEYSAHERIYRVRCVPLSYNEGVVDQALIVENNVSQEKRAEREIYAALSKEKQLNELKTSFVSMASHEFRTPLSSILSSAELVGKYSKNNQQDNILKHLNKIRNNVQNLTMILNDFLSLERIEGGYVKYNPEELLVKELINSVVEDVQQMLKPGQEIVIQDDTNNATWSMDVFLLRNMLTNLINNAVKYSDKDIIVRAYSADSKKAIEVVDQGIGISTQDQKRLFGRFYRASNAGQVQGTGLGLNIVKRYAKIMEAEITFESELNKGSIFRIEIDGDK